MIDLEDLYFGWLLTRLDPAGVTEGAAYLCGLLHNCDFHRRVGNDINRATDGANLRKEFLNDFAASEFDPHVTNDLMAQECSWFEMLIALSRGLDYLYDGGVDGRFEELVCNIGLDVLAVHDENRSVFRERHDQRSVANALSIIDDNMITPSGLGGLFPLVGDHHSDQRRVEIWEQAGAYFNERLEGV